MTPRPPSRTPPTPEEPLAQAGREPLHEAIAQARDERRGGISPATLVIASVASATASFTAAHLWGAGTVVSAALTPIVVALVSELLRRPVSATAARVVPRTAPQPATPDDARRLPPAPERWDTPPPPPPPRRRRLRLGPILITGLLAFVIVVGFYTVPDLLVGHSITGAGGATTFFSGGGGGGGTPAPTNTVTVTVPTTPAENQPVTVTETTPTTTETAPQQTTPTTATTPTVSTPAASPPATTTTDTTTTTTPSAP